MLYCLWRLRQFSQNLSQNLNFKLEEPDIKLVQTKITVLRQIRQILRLKTTYGTLGLVYKGFIVIYQENSRHETIFYQSII